MIKRCDVCQAEMFQDENNEWFCPKCEEDEFMTEFDKNDDKWLKAG